MSVLRADQVGFDLSVLDFCMCRLSGDFVPPETACCKPCKKCGKRIVVERFDAHEARCTGNGRSS